MHLVDRNWPANDEHWAKKSDEALVDIVLGGEPEDRQTAMFVLHDRYQNRLEQMMRSKLPEDFAADAVQNAWEGFYERVQVQGVTKGVSNLFLTIARNKRADAVQKLTRERENELDIFPTDFDDDSQPLGTGVSVEELIAYEEKLAIEEAEFDFLPHIGFVDSLLSDCQRVLWVLAKLHNYPSKVVGRLTGRSHINVNVQTLHARRRVRDYFESDEFEIALAARELPSLWEPVALPDDATIIERFSEPITPSLTPDELNPIGLPLEELQREYVASLMLPRWYDADHQMTGSPPSLLLTKRSDWALMETLHNRLSADPEDIPDEFPEECLIRVDVDNDSIVLRLEPMLQIVPDDPEFSLEPNTYLSIHGTRKKLPIVMGFFDKGVYTPELLSRWPFVDPSTGL